MLMIKYLGINPPFSRFYKSGLAAVEHAARTQFSQSVTMLSPQNIQRLLVGLSKGELPGWSGPPAPLFFFVLRNDAVDVTYGTVAGFQALGVPYMAHILPLSTWGQ